MFDSFSAKRGFGLEADLLEPVYGAGLGKAELSVAAELCKGTWCVPGMVRNYSSCEARASMCVWWAPIR